MPLEDFIIRVYCAVEAALSAVTGETRLRKAGFAPKLSDAEVLTMELVGEYCGLQNDKAIWHYFLHHWHAWFPQLGSRTTFVRQAANLWMMKWRLQWYWADRLGYAQQAVHLVDGFPLPVCHFRRAHFSQVFRGIAAYGHCASKAQTYYGLRGLVLIDERGVIGDIVLVPANVDERDAMEDLELQRIRGMLLGDKGFIRPELAARLAAQGISLQTPKRSNMQETRSTGFLAWMSRQRRLVETVIGQLAERFHIETTRARDPWHLTSRIARKIASHTLCVWMNRTLNGRDLDIENLVRV
jgi:hypothetical protein